MGSASPERSRITPALTPERIEFVLLCFEGPDLYSRAGGLGVRVAQLSRGLAGQGFSTHVVFVGDPERPSRESAMDGKLELHRWCQWISRYYPHGVYDGEEQKLYDFNETVPDFVAHHLVRPAVDQGRAVVVMAEEWHTAHAICEISDRLWGTGIRHQALLVWNANNTMGFDRINWGRLGYVTTITAVSRYMKHVMWGRGVNPVVIPNGIPDDAVEPPDAHSLAALRKALGEAGGRTLLVKVGRFDPDKRWLMAIDGVAAMKGMGLSPRLVMRGGIEPHEHEVLARAQSSGLRVAPVHLPAGAGAQDLASFIAAHPDVDVFHIKSFVPDPVLRALYGAADAVLANSGIEPFGLVGLEVMGTGGIAITGATGEDYAVAYHNAVVLETDDPREIAYHVRRLSEQPELERSLRDNARSTAQRYTWSRVIPVLLDRLQFAAERQGLSWSARSAPAQPARGRSKGRAASTQAAAALEEVR